MSSEFHLTIGAGPNTQDKALLKADVQMTKAALLYADKVKLCSIMSDVLVSEWDAALLSLPGYLKFLTRVLSMGKKPQLARLRNIHRYKELSKKKRRTRQELLEYAKLKTNFEKPWEKLKVDRSVGNLTGAEELRRARDAGILELYDFKQTDTQDEIAYEFATFIFRAALDGTTHPLFDGQASALIRTGIKKGHISITPPSEGRAKQVALAADLLKRLPQFDRAPMDEFLDIRKELQTPLVRFRSAIGRFSETIRSASWDQDFPIEAEEVFYKEIKPAVLEIEEAVKANHYLNKFVSNVVEKPFLSTLPFFSIFLGNVSDLSLISRLALSVGGLATMGSYTLKQKWEEARRIEQNQLFFYFTAGDLLESSQK